MIGKLNQKTPCKLIMEVGCNHKGELEIARQLIRAAHEAGADVVKFQKRTNRELLTAEQYDTPHPVPENAFGPTYGAHREFLEFSLDQHRELFKYCEELGIEYSTSVWDMTSAREIASLEPKLIKIPSASNLHFEMLGFLADNYGGEIHVSLGMTTREEEQEIVSFFEKKKRSGDVILYACTSGYPVPPQDICLLEISRLRQAYEGRVKGIGFSGHHISIYPDIAALTLGAVCIERHFTLGRDWKGTDHKASLEPTHAKELVTAIREVEAALTFKREEMLDIEKPQRDKLKWRAAQK